MSEALTSDLHMLWPECLISNLNLKWSEHLRHVTPGSAPTVPPQVLQKLGKADETRDAVFEEMLGNFNKQTVSRRTPSAIVFSFPCSGVRV